MELDASSSSECPESLEICTRVSRLAERIVLSCVRANSDKRLSAFADQSRRSWLWRDSLRKALIRPPAVAASVASVWRRLAEREGFLDAISEHPNDCLRFQCNACSTDDLPSSNVCRRSRPFAYVCRFLHRDVTRNDTRRESLPRL